MQYCFLLDSVAVLVRHWYEVGPSDEEHGTRVELRTIARPAHIGSESAAQPVTLDKPLWRADIFDLIGEPPGNLSRAHYHPVFDGPEPSSRHWDAGLREDWAEWLRAQLTDLPALLAAAGAQQHAADGQELTANQLDQLITAATSLLGANCDAGQRCLAATRDTGTAVTMMLQMFRPPGTGDPRMSADPRAWLFDQGPYGLAAAVILRFPAPLAADRLDDQQTSSAFIGVADAARRSGRAMTGVVHLDQQPRPVRGQPQDDRQDPFGRQRRLRGIGHQLGNEQLGILADRRQPPFPQHQPGMQPRAGDRSWERAQLKLAAERPFVGHGLSTRLRTSLMPRRNATANCVRQVPRPHAVLPAARLMRDWLGESRGIVAITAAAAQP